MNAYGPTLEDEDGQYLGGSIIKHCKILYGQGLETEVNLHIINNHILFNKKQNEGDHYIGFPPNPPVTPGGGIYNTQKSRIENNIISNNFCENHGGGIYNSGDVDIINNTIADNTSKKSGGGIYNNSSDININNNEVTGNAASRMGNGLYNAGRNVTICFNKIKSNESDSTVEGGGISNLGDEVYICQNEIAKNNAMASNSVSGSGVYNEGSNTKITDNYISGNSDEKFYYGGTIETYESSIIKNNKIIDNNANGIYINASGCTVEDNRILQNATGIFNRSNNDISNNSIINNSKNGIKNDGNKVSIFNNKIRNNLKNGVKTYKAIQIARNTITGNSLSGIVSESDSIITENLIANNKFGIKSPWLELIEENDIFNNSEYDFYYQSDKELQAINNYWGITNDSEITNKIYDYWNDMSLGEVIFKPLATSPFNDLPLEIVTSEIQDAEQGSPFQAYLDGQGGIPPYSWSISSGHLPQGIDIDHDLGIISGTPEEYGDFSFTVKIKDSAAEPNGYTKAYSLSVNQMELTRTLQVDILPQDAVEAGAKWRVQGTSTWHGSAEAVADVLVGEQQIEFKELKGWIAPEDIQVDVAAAGKTVALGTYENQAEVLSKRRWILVFYMGYWNRAADPGGLQYWMDRVESGELDIQGVADNFALSAEAGAVYPYLQSPDTANYEDRIEFLRTVYHNLMNRDVSAADQGIQYWGQELRSGRSTPGAAIGNIIHSAMVADAKDWQVIQNKIQVAEYFAWRFEVTDMTWQESDIELAQQALQGVTEDPESVDAAKDLVDQLLP